MSRSGHGEGGLPILRGESSSERPKLLAYSFDNVKMKSGSLEEQTQATNLLTYSGVLEKFRAEDTRDVVDLKMIRIPKGMTPEQVWELIKTDPEYHDEKGEVEWDLTGVEHEVALDADPRLNNLKDKSFWVVATRSSVDFGGGPFVPYLGRWEGRHSQA